jgi:hypothetical protein
MATCFIMDFAGGTREAYDAVLEEMSLGGQLPPGGLFHACGSTDSGWRVVDVWESPEVFQAFAEAEIGPLAAKHGLGEPQIQSFEVNETRIGDDAPVAFFQVVGIPFIHSEAEFAEMDKQITGDDRSAPPGCVYHVNGERDGGYWVADAWSSQEIHDEFMGSTVGRVMQEMGVTEAPDVQTFAIHNAMGAARPAAHA